MIFEVWIFFVKKYMIKGVNNWIKVKVLLFFKFLLVVKFICILMIMNLIIVLISIFSIVEMINCLIVWNNEKVLVINVVIVILNEMIFVVLLSKDLFFKIVIEFLGNNFLCVIVDIVIVFVGYKIVVIVKVVGIGKVG